MSADKHFVLDTNVLLHSNAAITCFADNTVVLPMTVIEELDKFKKNNDELGRNARQVIRTLDQLRGQGSLGKGVPTEDGGKVWITMEKEDDCGTCIDLNIPDNRIIATAYRLHKEGRRVIFVSKDINARLKADALGVAVMDFEQEKADFDQLYTGWRQIKVSASKIDHLYKGKELELADEEFLPNEFVLLVDAQNEKHTAIGRASKAGNLLRPLNPVFDSAFNLRPRSMEQRVALELLMDPEVALVTLVGQAGTGKTLLALAAGMANSIKADKYEKMLVSRPVIPLGKDIGYLPGSKDEKMKLWMQPIFDNLSYLMGLTNGGKQDAAAELGIKRLLREDRIELEALTYIRGRSISRQYVIIDEAQNLTPHEVKTIISRAGEGTKMILTGDPEQIDNPYLDASSNGLSYTVERLKGHETCGHITLTRSERSHLASLAAEYL
ncbi:PhoH family protein [Desulfobulbus rhabdoformis]|uniref:PhoH family protein n=1 Tax=Desulfobulbus rhabdoformis TaxID=34032 RepID=UPI001963F354|nr:PhoH family protein [Desulfobulbus rhabdoformis]MBM9616012.1 PhoH family protein [Desulfobulbus rhabdoformis]